MKTAFIFPGQGSQYVGMGKTLSETFQPAREVFECVNDSLSQDLTKLMFEGPEDALRLTENTQPALMAVSMAVMAVLEQEGGISIADKVSFVAGHSLGEYSALTAAGALKLEDTAKLLKLRGQAMQSAVPVGVGQMSAVLGLEFDTVKALCEEVSGEGNICEAANDNADGQVVISGHKDAVEKASALALEKGAKKAVPLPVSAPFHCSLMQPAAERMREALAATDIQNPSVPVVHNVLAATSDGQLIADLLVQQITGTVRWRESIQWMHGQGVDTMVEIGAGKVLCGLNRRIVREIDSKPVESPQEIEELIKLLV